MLRNFIDLFTPNICRVCEENLLSNNFLICYDCIYELPKTNLHLHPNDNKITEIFKGRANIEYAFAYYYYGKGLKTQKLIHLLKYNGIAEIGFQVGKLYGKELIENEFIKEIDFLIPVPLHIRKFKKRGFNQSEVFAKGLSEITKIPLNLISLQRIAFTETQTKKSRFKRWDNVKEKFHIGDKESIKGKHVAIIDDVITTGSTIESCVHELEKANVSKISIISMSLASN